MYKKKLQTRQFCKHENVGTQLHSTFILLTLNLYLKGTV